jgi:hypothetical protein
VGASGGSTRLWWLTQGPSVSGRFLGRYVEGLIEPIHFTTMAFWGSQGVQAKAFGPAPGDVTDLARSVRELASSLLLKYSVPPQGGGPGNRVGTRGKNSSSLELELFAWALQPRKTPGAANFGVRRLMSFTLQDSSETAAAELELQCGHH